MSRLMESLRQKRRLIGVGVSERRATVLVLLLVSAMVLFDAAVEFGLTLVEFLVEVRYELAAILSAAAALLWWAVAMEWIFR